jgi:hypothetical protein
MDLDCPGMIGSNARKVRGGQCFLEKVFDHSIFKVPCHKTAGWRIYSLMAPQPFMNHNLWIGESRDVVTAFLRWP